MSRGERHRRLLVAQLLEGTLQLDAEQAHYVRDVLRLNRGDTLELFDAAGFAARGTLASVGATVVVQVDELKPPEPACGPRCTIALAVPKGERADWAVEKLTELGVAHIAWLICERSVAVPRDGGQRLARWQRLAGAAAQQAARRGVPEQSGPTPFREFVAKARGQRLLADPGGAPLASVLARAAEEITLLVGPEGGFTEAELATAQAEGYTRVALAPHVLRIETAAMAGAAMLVGAGLTSREAS